jgi:hypothetical protein
VTELVTESIRSVRMESSRVLPHEATTVHTRILRCMLAVEDCYAYWKHVDTRVPPAERSKVAFEARWFGTKTEARVKTLVGDMLERFDAFPSALAALHAKGSVPAYLRPFVCHLHAQLADPIYRRFTGDLLPRRRALGHASIDLDLVSAWVEGEEAGRWAPVTRTKFASNLLATALDVGLVQGRRDPRKVARPHVPPAILGYALHLLREVSFEGSLTDNPYLRSLGVEVDRFATYALEIPGIRFASVGGVAEIAFEEPSLARYVARTFVEAA